MTQPATPLRHLRNTETWKVTPRRVVCEFEGLRVGARGFVRDCVTLQDGKLFIPMRVFARTGLLLGAAIGVAQWEGRLMLVAREDVDAPVFCYHSSPGSAVLTLPSSVDQEALALRLQRHVVFVRKGALMIGAPEDVPADLGRNRAVLSMDELAQVRFDKSRLATVEAPFEVDASKVLAWHDSSSVNGHVRLDGGTTEVVGLKIGDTLRYTQFANGVLVERAGPGLAAHVVRRGWHNTPDHPEPFQPRVWVSGKLLAKTGRYRAVALEDGSLFVMAANDAQAANCPEQRNLFGYGRSFCQHDLAEIIPGRDARASGRAWYRIGGLEFVAPIEARPSGPVPVHRYARPREGSRLQMQGAWLAKFGFKPGSRYEIVPEEGGGAVYVRLNPEGPLQVTAHQPGSTVPKLYVPAKWQTGFNGKDIAVKSLLGELRLSSSRRGRPVGSRNSRAASAAG